MVEYKGFRATVVLDTCFSYGNFRDYHNNVPFTARCLNGIDCSIIDVDKHEDPGLLCSEVDDMKEEFRDPSGIQTCWLSDPSRGAVITACSRTQSAVETKFTTNRQEEKVPDEAKQGILTYWLIDTLSMLCHQEPQFLWPSHARTVDCIRREIKRQQTPVIYGEGFSEFFGGEVYVRGECINVTTVGEGFEMDIGRAQGVEVSSIYTILPDDGDSSGASHPVQIEVFSAGTFKSHAKLLNPDTTERRPTTIDYQPSHLHQWALPDPVYLHFSGSFSEWSLLGAELAEKSGLKFGSGLPSELDLIIELDLDHYFRISRYGKPPLGRLPNISCNDPTWPTKLAQVLSHVTRFQALNELYHSSYNDHLPEAHFKLEADLEVRDGDTTELTLHYYGSLSSIWISLYIFDASWGISKLFPFLEGASHNLGVYSGEAEVSLTIQMTVPLKHRQDDQDTIEDDLVFFISTSPDGHVPSWGDICPPEIRPTGDFMPVEWARPPSQESESICNNKSGTSFNEAGGLKTTWAVIRQTIRTSPG